jgi:predicted site-specific integrase-resolvase
MNYVTAKEIKENLRISGVTLMKWKNSGKIKYRKLSDRKVLYDIDSLDSAEEQDNYNFKNVIYARVSTSGQKNDL